MGAFLLYWVLLLFTFVAPKTPLKVSALSSDQYRSHSCWGHYQQVKNKSTFGGTVRSIISIPDKLLKIWCILFHRSDVRCIEIVYGGLSCCWCPSYYWGHPDVWNTLCKAQRRQVVDNTSEIGLQKIVLRMFAIILRYQI